MACLYVLYRKNHPDEIRYVGITKYNDTKKRLSMHKSRLASGSTLPLYNWMRKYKDIESKVLYKDLTWLEACELEIQTIKLFKSKGFNLLNCSKDGGGYQELSDEARNKLAKSSTGRKHTNEAKKKMSEAKKGKTTWNKGIPMSEESKKKLSDSKKGKTLTEEHKEKISKSGKGRIVSKETRDKIGNAHKGKAVSEETKKKLSEAAKGKPAWNKGMKKLNDKK